MHFKHSEKGSERNYLEVFTNESFRLSSAYFAVSYCYNQHFCIG